MKKVLVLVIFMLLVSCGTKKHLVLSYNHVTGEVRSGDEMQHPNTMDVWNLTDDEFTIVLHDYRITNLTPISFDKDYKVDVEAGRAYFHSPFMSEYMEKNNWFTFDVTYTKKTW